MAMPAGRRHGGGRRSAWLKAKAGTIIGEKIDDLVETLAAPARQNPGDADAPGERTVNAVDDQGHAKPDEHPPPIGLRRGDQRKKREGGAGRGEKVNRGGPQARAHAASSTVCATRFAKSNGFETGRAPCGVASPLEVTLDLAEHGKVFIVIRSRALLQVHRLRLAIE